ncbi:MAG: biopolymer transporter ExbD [Deltaproteobacteria bacterium]|nr:biopolymer transporter ExbD [Deltaproteobacteria bacterium]
MSFSPREARAVIRKAVKRVPEGEEIRHLNIMPMMDMMTILLVAFIFQAATSATALTAGAVTLPKTLSSDELPEGASTLIITKTGIVVEGKAIVSVNNGDVDAAEKEGGAQGIKVPRLTNFLAALRAQEEQQKRARPGYDPAKAPPAELLIIADRTTPYRLLLQVMFSAKQKEAGYKHFRLIVQKSYPLKPSK